MKATIELTQRRTTITGMMRYSWRCVASNGEELARTTQEYSRRIDRDRAVAAVQNASLKLIAPIKRSKRGGWPLQVRGDK